MEAREEKEPAKLKFEEIAQFENPKKVKETYSGKMLLKRRDELIKMLDKYRT